MQLCVLTLIVLCSRATFATAAAEFKRRTHLVEQRDDFSKSLYRRYEGVDRRLKQTESEQISVCRWGEFSECLARPETALSLLETKNNTVNNYLTKQLTCGSYFEEFSCVSNGCDWFAGEYCGGPVELEKELYSAECFADARHILDQFVGRSECSKFTFDFPCNEKEECVWTGDSCAFDLWQYFYGIKSTAELIPAEYITAKTAYKKQLEAQVKDGLASNTIEDPKNISTVEPGAFKCPEELHDIVCNLTMKASNILRTELYCSLNYQTTDVLIDCGNDPLCALNSNDPSSVCGSNAATILSEYSLIMETFINNIEDPNAKNFESKRNNCTSTTNKTACNDECSWIPAFNTCTLAPVFIHEEIDRLTTESDDPACAFVNLRVDTGCIYIVNKTECNDDDKCSLSEGRCDVSPDTWIDYALDRSDLLDDFEEVDIACSKKKEEKDCLSLEFDLNRTDSNDLNPTEAPMPAPESVTSEEYLDFEEELESALPNELDPDD